MSRLDECISLYNLILLVHCGEHDNSIDMSPIFLGLNVFILYLCKATI